MQRITTSKCKSSIEAAENVGTKSAPFIIEVIKLSPDSANSHVIQAAARVTRCQVQKTWLCEPVLVPKCSRITTLSL